MREHHKRRVREEHWHTRRRVSASAYQGVLLHPCALQPPKPRCSPGRACPCRMGAKNGMIRHMSSGGAVAESRVNPLPHRPRCFSHSQQACQHKKGLHIARSAGFSEEVAGVERQTAVQVTHPLKGAGYAGSVCWSTRTSDTCRRLPEWKAGSVSQSSKRLRPWNEQR